MEENVDAAFVHNINDGWIDRQGTCKVCKAVQGTLEGARRKESVGERNVYV